MRQALKTLAVGLTALTAYAAAASDASAQRATRSKPRAAATAPQLDRERGAREAPAAMAAAGTACAISDAAYIGSPSKVLNAYEVACRDGVGFIVVSPQTPGAAAAQAQDCLNYQAAFQAAAPADQQKGMLQCRLPGNAQPAQSLRGYVTQAGGACTITNGRYVGEFAAAKALRYEVSCSEGAGYFIDQPRAGGKAKLTGCLTYVDTPNACTLTTKAQVLAGLAPLVAQSKRPCTVTNAKYVGQTTTTKNDVLEIGCETGRPGFFIETDAGGKFVRAADCGRLGTCTFTNAELAQSAQREDVQRRLRAAGSDCTVGEFRAVGAERETEREIYEVTCTNRPQGAFVALASASNSRNDLYDCLFAPRWGTTCQLTQESLTYPRVAAAMTMRGKNPGCKINTSRWMGRTDQGENWFELSCADGRAFVVDYRGNGMVANTLTCRDAANIGAGCRAGDRGSVPKD